ncbi:unnamed protein product [Brassica oleracea]
MKHSFTELGDVSAAHLYHVQVQRLFDVTLWISEQQTLEPRRKCYKSCRLKYKHGQQILRVLFKMRLPQLLQDLNHQFSFGKGTFQVKHKWRFRQFQVLLLVRVACGIKEFQPYEFFHGSSPIFLFNPSLRSSLFSKWEVYMRVHACLLIVGVLIWWFTTTRESDLINKYVREQKEKTGQSILWKIEVASYHLLKERRFIILMFFKRHMLQILIQQRQKWKKCYKTWMFKYKARIKQVQALLLHGGWCSWSSSCVLWHRWRRKDNSRCSSVMAGLFERKKHGETSILVRGIYICCAHVLWSGWSVHSGNKLMQQRRRSKNPKSFMFNYKEKGHVLSLPIVVVLDFQQGKGDQNDHDSFVQWFLSIQACGQACFHGESIDRYLK